MFQQANQLVKFWKLNKADAIIWIVTLLVVILINIAIGLLAGLLVSLVIIILQVIRPYTCLLGHIPHTDLYLNLGRYKAAVEIHGIKIFHYCGTLNFANNNYFKSIIYRLVGVCPRKIIKYRKKLAEENRFLDERNSRGTCELQCIIMDMIMSKPDKDYNDAKPDEDCNESSTKRIQDPLFEFEELNPMDVLTSNEILDNIKVYDSTIEIIGYVDSLEAPRIVGKEQQYKFFKFYLNNGSGKRVQCVVWNDDVDRIEPFIKSNYIIHLDGVQARIPKVAHFNNGNMPYELQLRSNTVINNLGKYEIISPSNVQAERVKFTDVLNTSTCVILEGYIKTNFASIHNAKLNKTIGCGSLTDGEFKIEVHIMNFNDDEYYDTVITKGDKVQIIGTMQATEPSYFLVQDIKDVKKMEGRLSLIDILKGSNILKKKNSDSFQEYQNKKKKTE